MSRMPRPGGRRRCSRRASVATNDDERGIMVHADWFEAFLAAHALDCIWMIVGEREAWADGDQDGARAYRRFNSLTLLSKGKRRVSCWNEDHGAEAEPGGSPVRARGRRGVAQPVNDVGGPTDQPGQKKTGAKWEKTGAPQLGKLAPVCSRRLLWLVTGARSIARSRRVARPYYSLRDREAAANA